MVSNTCNFAALIATLPLFAAVPVCMAADVDPSELVAQCAEPFKFEGGKCTPKPEAIKAIESADKCKAPTLKWTPNETDKSKGTCAAVSGSEPKPECGSKVPGLKYKDGKCLISLTPEEDKRTDFFKDWAVGIGVLHPRIKSVTDASIVNDKVRVHGEIRQESVMLVARHFYPFNPGRHCVQGGQFAAAGETPGGLNGVTGFLKNCVGAMVAAGVPTSGAANGQIINFLGLGLAIGGGISGSNEFNWHLGVGRGRKFNTRTLGDGWVEGEAPPTGETQVRFKSIDVDANFVYFTLRW